MNLLEIIPTDKQNAVKRKELVELTGMYDEDIRAELKKLTANGNFIIASPKGGYYITENVEEIERYLHSIDSRIKALYLNYLAMRKYVANARGQKITKVRQHFRRLGVDIVDNQVSMFGG